MEFELQAAVEEYRTQLTAVEELLANDPGNAEVLEVFEQLQGALHYTLTALAQVDSQQAAPEGSAAAPELLRNDIDGNGDGVEVGAQVATATGAGPWQGPRGGAPNNARMHPANRYYRQEPDFAALAQQYEELQPHVSIDTAGRAHLDTTSWVATRALTACLLRSDFGVRWWLPEGQLVPPLTNRANYVHWLNDLLHLSSPPGGGPIRGLDIGCGANFIYCLLGAVQYGWYMVGVDVTKVAVGCCRQLITDNPQLAPLLEVRDLSALHPELQTPEAAVPAGSAELGPGRRGRKRQGRRQGQGHDQDQGQEQEQDTAQPFTAVSTSETAAAAAVAGAAAAAEAADDAGAAAAAEAADDAAQAADREAAKQKFGAAVKGPRVGSQGAGAATAVPAGHEGDAGPISRDGAARAGADVDADAGGQVRGCSGESAGEGSHVARDGIHCAAPCGGEGGGEAAAEAWDGNEQGVLLPAFADEEETFAFTMCNPPFFESMQEAAQNPNTAFGGTAAEMVCPGGELAFVLQMLVESEALQDRVHWFSTMVGKKSTLKALRRELHSRHVTALRTTELAQGKTSRWAVAWSWQVDPNKAAQPIRRIITAGDQIKEGASLQPEAGELGSSLQTVAAAAAPGNGQVASAVAASGAPLLPRRHMSFTVQLAGSLNSRTILPEVQRLLREQGCGPLQLDTAAWTVSWPLQVAAVRVVEQAHETCSTAGVKRPRDEATAESGSFASNIMARLRIAQQQRGRIELVATIPNTAPDAAARAFAGIMGSLERALALS